MPRIERRLCQPGRIAIRDRSNAMFRFAYIIPAGGAGGADMKQADLTSQVNGERNVFTLPETYETGTVRVYLNGLRQVKSDHFTEPNQTQITLLFTPQTGDFLTVDYIPAPGG